MNLTRLGVMLAALVQLAGAGVMDQMLVRDSLGTMPRWEQVRWLAKRRLPDPYLRDFTPVQDSGLRCVGRWSFGPSTWVDVRATSADTVVFLSRGSGVSIIRFRSQDSLRLDLLSDINSHGLTGRCQVRDTLLYVNSGGVECYDIGNLSNPVLLNWLSQPLMYDFFVVDTLLYTSSRDSLRIFSVSNPASPRWLGACADSGYVIYVSGSHAYLGHQAGLRLGRMRLLQEVLLDRDVVRLEEQHAARGLAVAADAPRLLHVRLGRARHLVVDDVANIRLVYAKPEGIGGDHHHLAPG